MKRPFKKPRSDTSLNHLLQFFGDQLSLDQRFIKLFGDPHLIPLVPIRLKPTGKGFFAAYLGDDQDDLCLSRTPILDAARELLRRGYDSKATWIAYRDGGVIVDAFGEIRISARAAISETKNAPRLRKWRPLDTFPFQQKRNNCDGTGT